MAVRSLMCLLTQQKEQLREREQDLTKYFLATTNFNTITTHAPWLSSSAAAATTTTSGNSGISDRRLTSSQATTGGVSNLGSTSQSKENDPPPAVVTTTTSKQRTRRALFQDSQKNPPLTVPSQVESKDHSNQDFTLGSNQTLFEVLGGMAPIDAMIDHVYSDGSLNIRLKYFLKRFMVRALNGPGRITSSSLQVTYSLLIHDRGMDPNCLDKLAGTVCRILKEKGSPASLLTEVSTAILTLQEEIRTPGNVAMAKSTSIKAEEQEPTTTVGRKLMDNGGKTSSRLNSNGNVVEEKLTEVKSSHSIVNRGCVAQVSMSSNNTTTVSPSVYVPLPATVPTVGQQQQQQQPNKNASTLAKEILGNFTTHVSKYFEQKALLGKRETSVGTTTTLGTTKLFSLSTSSAAVATGEPEKLKLFSEPYQFTQLSQQQPQQQQQEAVMKVVPEAIKPLSGSEGVKLSVNPITVPYDALKDRRRRRRQLQQNNQLTSTTSTTTTITVEESSTAASAAAVKLKLSSVSGSKNVEAPASYQSTRHSTLLQILCEQNRQQQQHQQQRQLPQQANQNRCLEEDVCCEISIPLSTANAISLEEDIPPAQWIARVSSSSSQVENPRTITRRKPAVSFVLPSEGTPTPKIISEEGTSAAELDFVGEKVEEKPPLPHYYQRCKPPQLDFALIDDVGLDMDMDFVEDSTDDHRHLQQQERQQPVKHCSVVSWPTHTSCNVAVRRAPAESSRNPTTSSSIGTTTIPATKAIPTHKKGVTYTLSSGEEYDEIIKLWSQTGPRGFHIIKVEKVLNPLLYEKFIQNQSTEVIQSCLDPQNLKWHGSKYPYAVVEDGFLIQNISTDGSVWFHDEASYSFIYNGSVLLLAAVRPGVSYRDGRHQCFVEGDMCPAYVVSFKING